MASGVTPLPTQSPTVAGLLWPARTDASSAALRAAVLMILGSCLLTLSAKVQVPLPPVPMTLQTLAVMALGAMLGLRLGVGAVLVYLAQGAMGLPVFANTPPMAPTLAYFMGPTGGFLAGFVVAAAMVGWATDRGWMARPVRFGLMLTAANVALMAVGFVWLALLAQMSSGATGIGFAKAWAVGVAPFMVGNALKLAIAVIAAPLLWKALNGAVRR